jgi:hypothetical protein
MSLKRESILEADSDGATKAVSDILSDKVNAVADIGAANLNATFNLKYEVKAPFLHGSFGDHHRDTTQLEIRGGTLLAVAIALHRISRITEFLAAGVDLSIRTEYLRFFLVKDLKDSDRREEIILTDALPIHIAAAFSRGEQSYFGELLAASASLKSEKAGSFEFKHKSHIYTRGEEDKHPGPCDVEEILQMATKVYRAAEHEHVRPPGKGKGKR